MSAATVITGWWRRPTCGTAVPEYQDAYYVVNRDPGLHRAAVSALNVYGESLDSATVCTSPSILAS